VPRRLAPGAAPTSCDSEVGTQQHVEPDAVASDDDEIGEVRLPDQLHLESFVSYQGRMEAVAVGGFPPKAPRTKVGRRSASADLHGGP
jgi:hypothetical protein